MLHTTTYKYFSFSFKGIRDDLEFLLEEDLSSINLCALHCELRNTEQLLASLGLFAYKVGSLDECNAELSNYGPENFNNRITVKIKEGQETAVEKHNIQVSSFSGSLYFFIIIASALVHLRALSYGVMFKTRAAVFYRDLKPRGAAEWWF